MSRVLVVGGGISGLAAARHLAGAGLDVTLAEAGTRWGGKLAPVALAGLTLDGGAESMLARRPEAVGLLTDLGLTSRTVHPTAAKPRVLVGGTTHRLPPSLQGVPTDVGALAPLLSPAGAAYAAGETSRAAPALAGDVSIGDYVDDRFGPEVTDRLLEPLLGGVYAGRARRLSFEAVAPVLFAAARDGGSLLGHARATLAPATGKPVFAGLDGGVHGVVDALLAELDAYGVHRRTSSPVTRLEREPDGRWRAELPGGSLRVDAVVLAAPAAPTARLLAPYAAAAHALAEVPYASTAVLTLVVRGLAPADSGLLVPPGELATVKALTYSSAKWSWVADQVRTTWGADVAVVRVSVGRAGEAALLQLDDAALVARSYAEVRGLAGWEDAELVEGVVTRWGGALPQYRVGHRDLVTRLRTEVAPWRGLAVAGAALDGVGIAACLATAEAAVTKIIGDLAGEGGKIEDRTNRQGSSS